MMQLGHVLYCWRLYNKFSLREAAKYIGLPHSTLVRVEAGKPVDGATLITLLSWLLRETTS
jgi:hypothetical protein